MTVRQHKWLTCLRYLKPYICLEIYITFSISVSLILPQGVIVYLVLVYSFYWQNFCEHIQLSLPLEILHLNSEHRDHVVVTGNSRAHTNTAEYGLAWCYQLQQVLSGWDTVLSPSSLSLGSSSPSHHIPISYSPTTCLLGPAVTVTLKVLVPICHLAILLAQNWLLPSSLSHSCVEPAM